MFFILLSLKSLSIIAKIQPRITCATINNYSCTTIISCNRPTNLSDEKGVIILYDKLSSFIQHIPKHNVLIIGGDMNVHISKGEDYKYCFHNFQVRNSESLANFAIKNRLECQNIKFQKSKEKLLTYCQITFEPFDLNTVYQKYVFLFSNTPPIYIYIYIYERYEPPHPHQLWVK